MKKLFTLIMLLFATISMFSCSFEQENNDIYVTVYPMQYIVEEIFENTEYTVGIVPGVTSHESSVDWSPKEIIAMTEAELLFYVGANYDYYIEKSASVKSGKDHLNALRGDDIKSEIKKLREYGVEQTELDPNLKNLIHRELNT